MFKKFHNIKKKISSHSLSIIPNFYYSQTNIFHTVSQLYFKILFTLYIQRKNSRANDFYV